MEAMRASWTDDRMDDLNGKVDALHLEMRSEFKAVRGEMKDEFAAVRAEMQDGFDKVDKRFDKVDRRFETIDGRLYAMQRLMIQFCGVALAALLGVLGALVAVAIQL